MRNQIGLGLAASAVVLFLSGTLHAAPANESFGQGGSNANDKQCEVSIDRSFPTGTYDVKRQELDNGDCICYAYTGPSPQSNVIESKIADLQRRRECSDASPLAAGPSTVSGRGFFGGFPFLPLLGAGGTTAALAAGGGQNAVSP